jgi:hypothetical protein
MLLSQAAGLIFPARRLNTGGELMRYVISSFTACALAGTLSVFAQEPQPPQPPPEQQEPQAPPSSTLTGCVQEAKTTDGGKAFILNKAQGGNATMYLLVAEPPTEVASHVNHKVEVMGKVHEPKPPAEGTEPNPKALRPPMVQVESVKMVAENCE